MVLNQEELIEEKKNLEKRLSEINEVLKLHEKIDELEKRVHTLTVEKLEKVSKLSDPYTDFRWEYNTFETKA